MANQQLIDWIRNQISQKRDSEEIRGFLIEKGYNIDDVNEAIHVVVQEPVPKQTNNPTKRWVLPLIISLLVVAIIGSSILLLADKDNEPPGSYFDYVSKKENLQALSTVYDIKLPMVTALSGQNINSKKITLEVYRKQDNEKRVLTFNESGKTDTFSYFNINDKHTSCWTSSHGEISCNVKNVSKEELRRTTVTIPDDISALLNNMDIVYRGEDNINHMNCALFRVDIDNLDKFMDAIYSLTQGLSVSPETPGILDICVDEETGTILNMKLSSAKKSSFGENLFLSIL